MSNETSRRTVRRWVPLGNSLVRLRAMSIYVGAGPGVRRLVEYCVVLTLALACGKKDAGSDSTAVTRGSGGPARDSSAPASHRRTVLIVGTSLTAGLGLDPEQAYPALLQRKADSAGLGVEVVNAGLSGETSAGALRRIEWLLNGPVDVLVLETGANDGLRGLPIEGTRANIKAILERVKARKPGARLALVQMEAPPNLGERYTSEFRAMFPEVARETGAVLLPFLLEGVAGVDRMNQEDGIHPNVEGEKVVAGNVWRGLVGVLEGK